VIAALNDSYVLFSPGEVPLYDVRAHHPHRGPAFRIGSSLGAVSGVRASVQSGARGLSRLMPQMQVFSGLPLSILIGFLIPLRVSAP
jgi:hypothetical protein